MQEKQTQKSWVIRRKGPDILAKNNINVLIKNSLEIRISVLNFYSEFILSSSQIQFTPSFPYTVLISCSLKLSPPPDSSCRPLPFLLFFLIYRFLITYLQMFLITVLCLRKSILGFIYFTAKLPLLRLVCTYPWFTAESHVRVSLTLLRQK